ncbi:MAG: tRNA pseudouridine(13) synthase TruD [Candidatus Aureabacteria bacterium]|nr:tRNA pseudouridine(13) synthase TruD [Candidatus Auribacterota bacterium]
MSRIKVCPDDFIVEEITHEPLNETGAYGIFILSKKGWNTVDAIYKLAKTFNLSLKDIHYGGRKDRHAHTVQTITIKNAFSLSHTEENLSLEYRGRMDRPMGPDLILSNRFQVTVRDLTSTEVKTAIDNIQTVQRLGFSNYFDDQRFGSFDPVQGFLAEKILKGHYNGALKIYLTRMQEGESREKKSFFFREWGNWCACLKEAGTDWEKEYFLFLVRHPKAYLPLLQKIPGEEMASFFSAYQGFLWNEILRQIIRSSGGEESYPGCCGDYHFLSRSDVESFSYLKNLKIPLPSSKAQMPDERSTMIYEGILNERKIRPSLFNLRKIRQAYFKSIDRNALVVPESLSWGEEADEIYPMKKKIRLGFILPRGSYATMFIKSLFPEKLSTNFSEVRNNHE